MRKLILLLLMAAPAAFPYASFSGFCQQGGIQITVAGQRSTQYAQQSYPNFTQSGAGPSVTVYYTGTTTKVSIYSDNNGTSLGNPFPCTSTGQFSFFANVNVADLLFSGTGISAFTRGASPGGTLTAYVTNFGAKGNGAADDTAAIQATINYLSNSGTAGGTVVVPFGSYKTGAVTMKSNVSMICEAGTTFLASTNSEIMFNFGAVAQTGVSGSGGDCTVDGNGKSSFQAIGVTGTPGVTANMLFSNILIKNSDVGIETTNLILSSLQNVRVFAPTTAAFEFQAGTTTITCDNCSSIATTGSPYCFEFNNGGQIVVNGGACEGSETSAIFQENGVAFNGTDFENSGTPNSTPWIQLGVQTSGNDASSISFNGVNFGAGASYALLFEQASGVSVHGSTFLSDTAAFAFNNSGTTYAVFRDLDFAGNTYRIGGGAFDPTKIILYANGQANDLSNNVSVYNINPNICIPVLPGTAVNPPTVGLAHYLSVDWCDGSTGLRHHEWQDGSGTLHRQIDISDVGLSAVKNPINLITDSGSSSNAIVGSLLNADGTATALTSGLVVLFPLTGGVGLRAGANTFNFNGGGPVSIKANSNQVDIPVAIASGGAVWLRYNGTYWDVLTQ